MSPLRTVLGLAMLVAGGLLPSAPLRAAPPSYDCSAEFEATAPLIVCDSAQLSALDRELDRLFRLAAKEASGADLSRLKAEQRGWVKGRDECWKGQDFKGCIASSYLSRMAELRSQFPAIRESDGEGITTGPVAYRCDSGATLAFTEVAAGPTLAFVEQDGAYWLDFELLTERDGRIFQGVYADGPAEWRIVGDAVEFRPPGGEWDACHPDRPGRGKTKT